MPIITRTALAAVAAILALAGPLAAPAGADPSAAEVEKRLKAASAELEVVVEQYNALRLDVTRSRTEADTLRSRLAPLESAAAARGDEVGTLAAAAYRTGRAANAIGLLDAGSPGELGGRLAMLEVLGRQRAEAVAALAAARRDVAVAQESLAVVTAREKAQGAQLLTKKREIEREIDRLNTVRAGLSLDDVVPARVPPPSSLPPGAASEAVRFAYAQLGKPYRWGAAGPDGYDCSGLTSAAWRAAGVALPHNARAQYGAVARIGRDQLRPGDLVFYYSDIHHVGLYVGDGRIIHAPQHGERIRFDRFDFQPIHGYGRPG